MVTAPPTRMQYRRPVTLGWVLAVLLTLALAACGPRPAPEEPAPASASEPSDDPASSPMLESPFGPETLSSTDNISPADTTAVPSLEPLDHRLSVSTTPVAEPVTTPRTNPPAPVTPAAVVPTNLPPAIMERTRPAAIEPPRPVADTFEAQLALDRLGFSPGSIDGVFGGQTAAALRAFQNREGLTPTGTLDERTRQRLQVAPPLYLDYVVTEGDIASLRAVGDSWLEKSRQDKLGYQSVLELVAERGHASPTFVRKLNPRLTWPDVPAGTVVRIPNAYRPAGTRKAASVNIRLGDHTLQALDEQGHVIAHFPCSIAKRVEARPVGDLKVEVMVEDPNYTFDPERFPDTPEGRTLTHKLIIPPGPNNPVGMAWIGLDRPGYGMHGTPEPEKVGRTESLGCFRLANWNARHLLTLAWIGMPIHVEL